MGAILNSSVRIAYISRIFFFLKKYYRNNNVTVVISLISLLVSFPKGEVSFIILIENKKMIKYTI